MTDDNVIQLPEDIDLDLDAYERPAKDVIKPFAVKLGGRRVVMTNPDEVDWKDLLDITDPVSFLRHCCTPEDRAHIMGLSLPGHTFSKLIETFMDHYKMREKIEEAQRRERLGY